MALSEAWASEGPYYEIRHLLGGSDGPLTCKHGVLWLSGEVFHGVYILYGNSHALLYGILTVCRIFCFLLCFVVYIVLVFLFGVYMFGRSWSSSAVVAIGGHFFFGGGYGEQ